jgi:hypothetical protein
MEGEMYALTSGLIVYNNIPKDSILFRLSEIIRRSEEGGFSGKTS